MYVLYVAFYVQKQRTCKNPTWLIAYVHLDDINVFTILIITIFAQVTNDFSLLLPCMSRTELDVDIDDIDDIDRTCCRHR